MKLSQFDKGPFVVDKSSYDKHDVYIHSEDFSHDVMISINGDFEDSEQKREYAKAVAVVLNNALADKPIEDDK